MQFYPITVTKNFAIKEMDFVDLTAKTVNFMMDLLLTQQLLKIQTNAHNPVQKVAKMESAQRVAEDNAM